MTDLVAGSHAWSRLGPEHYTEESFVDAERARVFSPAWQPVGLVKELENDRDFLCVEVAGHSVVIQNFRGVLRAFENVCSHRQSPIRTCARGNGPLQCPYHGWTYDEEGRVVGIPQRKSFGHLSSDVLQQLTLDAWGLEVVGPLVFVCRKPTRGGLQQALGELGSELTPLLQRAQRCLDRGSFELACNWKVMLENGLDAYHVPLVHADTIHKHGLHELSRERHGEHSAGRFVAASGARVLRALRYAFPGADISDRYTHYLLFPNVYVVSVYDLFLVVSRMDPRRADLTQFESFVFVTWDGDAGNVALREELNASNAAFFRNGYQEDKQICEHVQRRLRHTHRRALLGAEEERIPMFHQAWLERMALDLQINPEPREQP
ncbi:MAG: Rieske (2Fe-2S) iron-sulfur domain protein [Myxococcaceae bacterium]|nr:Rieske (2Fe-2S) iron-sulfur domain protein [Myxococcaceae bacterium]